MKYDMFYLGLLTLLVAVCFLVTISQSFFTYSFWSAVLFYLRFDPTSILLVRMDSSITPILNMSMIVCYTEKEHHNID